ncbi:MAG: hypothetical protein R2742_04170 [Micropruina glycogenica]
MTEPLVHRAPTPPPWPSWLGGWVAPGRSVRYRRGGHSHPAPAPLADQRILAQRLGPLRRGHLRGVSFVTRAAKLHDLGDPVRFWQPRQLAWRLLQVSADHPTKRGSTNCAGTWPGRAIPTAWRPARGQLSPLPALATRNSSPAGWPAATPTNTVPTSELRRLAACAVAARGRDPLAATAGFLQRLRDEPAALTATELSFVQLRPAVALVDSRRSPLIARCTSRWSTIFTHVPQPPG